MAQLIPEGSHDVVPAVREYIPHPQTGAAQRLAGIVWEARTLDRFLTNPLRAVPGTTMGYAGIDDAQERADLIAYLRDAAAKCAK